MKLVNYQLQTQIEYLGENKTNSHFKDYLKSVLEDTSKPYYQRADYIGLSKWNQIKNWYPLFWYFWTSSFKEKINAFWYCKSSSSWNLHSKWNR